MFEDVAGRAPLGRDELCVEAGSRTTYTLAYHSEVRARYLQARSR